MDYIIKSVRLQVKSLETEEWGFPSEVKVYFLLQPVWEANSSVFPLFVILCSFHCETLKFPFSILIFNTARIEGGSQHPSLSSVSAGGKRLTSPLEVCFSPLPQELGLRPSQGSI